MSVDTQQPDLSALENDFSAFEQWRETGELPEKEAPKETSSETPKDEEPEVETEPESDPEDTKQEEPKEDGDEERPKGKGFQKRISQLTQKIRGLEAEIQKRSTAPEPKPEVATPKSEGKPSPDNFNSYEEYVEALTDYRVEQRLLKQREEAQQQEAQAQQKQILDRWNEQSEAAREKFEDFDEVLNSVPPPPPAIQYAIMSSDQAAEVAYHLAQNPKELARIAKLEPLAAAREIGKLEVKLSKPVTPPATPKPKVTSAPAPIKPVGGQAKAPRSITDQELIDDYPAWEKARAAQLKRK